jgi:ketosteroid isomerase-like protein
LLNFCKAIQNRQSNISTNLNIQGMSVMGRMKSKLLIVLCILLISLTGKIYGRASAAGGGIFEPGCNPASNFNGLYRIDVNRSDKLYSVIGEASSSVPFADQQQFFIDLAVRLTPPDLLAIECSGKRVSLASSRAPRLDFMADGVTRTSRSSDGNVVRSRIAFERNSLTFNSSGKGDDSLNFTFTPLENGRRLRVTRRITSRELIEPVVINTVYEKLSEIISWNVLGGTGGSQVASQQNLPDRNQPTRSNIQPPQRGINGISENQQALNLRESLNEWIRATNNRNIDRQMFFYMPQLKAFYLSRNASLNAVRVEKTRVFANARSIDIRAEEPEIIFQDGGQTAIMRFRKKYNVQTGSRTNSGEVIQELRWQRSRGGNWKIFSERDIRVLR